MTDANTNLTPTHVGYDYSYWPMSHAADDWYNTGVPGTIAAPTGFGHPGRTKNVLFIDLHASGVTVAYKSAVE